MIPSGPKVAKSTFVVISRAAPAGQLAWNVNNTPLPRMVHPNFNLFPRRSNKPYRVLMLNLEAKNSSFRCGVIIVV